MNNQSKVKCQYSLLWKMEEVIVEYEAEHRAQNGSLKRWGWGGRVSIAWKCGTFQIKGN